VYNQRLYKITLSSRNSLHKQFNDRRLDKYQLRAVINNITN